MSRASTQDVTAAAACLPRLIHGRTARPRKASAHSGAAPGCRPAQRGFSADSPAAASLPPFGDFPTGVQDASGTRDTTRRRRDTACGQDATRSQAAPGPRRGPSSTRQDAARACRDTARATCGPTGARASAGARRDTTRTPRGPATARDSSGACCGAATAA